MVAIKAHFDGKVFVPDEPVNLPSGQPVTMQVTPTPAASPIPDGPAPGQHTLDWIAENLVITNSGLPSDASVQHDHYLYGTPRRPVSE